MEVKFKRYSDNAIKPMRGTVGSVGYDLYSSMNKILVPFKPELIRTYIQLAIPAGCCVKIARRSGLALSGIFTHLGTIDSEFWNVVRVLLTNISHPEHQIKKGDRIGQIIFEK